MSPAIKLTTCEAYSNACVDEFQNFITPSMAAILSGARKYHLGMTLVHQDMQQLVKQESELASAVISNRGTRVCFRVGDVDAKRFAEGFAHFEAAVLQNLNVGETIVRIDRPEYDFTMSIAPLSDSGGNGSEIAEKVIAHTRTSYATAREEVEATFGMLRELIQEETVTVNVEQPTKHFESKVEVTETKTEVPLTEEGTADQGAAYTAEGINPTSVSTNPYQENGRSQRI